MSLSFAPLDPCGNSISSLYGANLFEPYHLQIDSHIKPDILELYTEELDRRKQYLTTNSNDVDKNELDDLNFLKNIIKIKLKISTLKSEHKSLLEKYQCIEKEIADIENVKSMYENFSAGYLSILNKEGDKKIMTDLLKAVKDKYTEKEKLDKNINDLLLEITFMRNLIRVDNDNEEPIIDTETNPALLCFTCHESHITHCFSPCGHSFCENCVSRVNLYSNNAICFMCRAKVTGKIKLYFS